MDNSTFCIQKKFTQDSRKGIINFMRNKRFLEQYNALKLGWLHDSIFFVVLIVIIFVVFRFVIGVSIVGGASMEPTLYDGNVVVYLRTVRAYEPGDVITMRVPSGEYYVKRVAATAGETVELIDGDVYIDGSLMDDPWGEGETNEESGAVIYPYTVQDGNVFVLGDNREVSMDSRMFGEVNRRQIRGRMILVIGSGGIHTLKQ